MWKQREYISRARKVVPCVCPACFDNPDSLCLRLSHVVVVVGGGGVVVVVVVGGGGVVVI